MKPLVIYHDNCADGFGAAFAAWLKLGDDAEYVPMQYGKPFPTSEPHERDVYILDFSFPREVMEFVFSRANRVTWIDHHASAMKEWGVPPDARFEHSESYYDYGNNVKIILDNNRSGAMLAWEYFHPGSEVPMLFKHIDDYDRWQFKLEGTKEINKAMWSYAPWSFQQWVTFDNNPHPLYSQGEAILRAHDQNVQAVAKNARECRIPIKTEQYGCTSEPGLAANCPPHLTSDVGHELAKQSGSYGLCWTMAREGMTAQCSLRSNGDYDVSAIAKAFGGGGHKNAAGFEVPIETLLSWL